MEENPPQKQLPKVKIEGFDGALTSLVAIISDNYTLKENDVTTQITLKNKDSKIKIIIWFPFR